MYRLVPMMKGRDLNDCMWAASRCRGSNRAQEKDNKTGLSDGTITAGTILTVELSKASLTDLSLTVDVADNNSGAC